MHGRIFFMQKRWNVLESCPPEFAAKCGEIHSVVPHLLWHRGVRDPEEVERFFNPDYESGVHDPFLFTQMRRAVDRVFEAIRNEEKILVFGDYDADGLTGSAMIVSQLRDLVQRLSSNAIIETYIPHRDEEGYGLQMPQVERFAGQNIGLLITVDCGIACPKEVEQLGKQGTDVIIVDHHQYGEDLPDAYLVHPSVPNETYPFKHLAAVGVAWKFVSALIQAAREQ
ncbi:single-stranded-DNA-specific exonuclease RecJ, partial [Candidatus Uhrbacteria bacterium]|nr:single-stranded-DNA-specific exonuclease RecJ [Candidatus Uhrbacteria bacterium]